MIEKPRKKGTSYREKWSKFRKQYLAEHEQWGEWYECSKCKKWCKAWDIDLHHLEKRSQRPDLIFVSNNIILVCRSSADIPLIDLSLSLTLLCFIL